MDEFFRTLGLSETVFSLFVLPALIFLARVAEVSTNTIRIIYMLGGRRSMATILGFFEALIWLIAIRQVFQHIDNWPSYIAYPGGFAAGIYVGMIIEDRIAYGKVIVRIITPKEVNALLKYLHQSRIRFTKVSASGADGNENLIFTVLKREKLPDLIQTLASLLPTAFYTIETVKTAKENEAMHTRERLRFFTWLRGVARN
ncbi:MAG: hypothetical protein JST14_08000 [Bacteroidetes bacterium]|nr:hypothetical protein [Bacteroidota bacterium]